MLHPQVTHRLFIKKYKKRLFILIVSYLTRQIHIFSRWLQLLARETDKSIEESSESQRITRMSKGWCDRAGTVSLFWVETLEEPVWQTENLPASWFGSSLYERQIHDVATAACFLVTCRFSEASCKQRRFTNSNTKRDRTVAAWPI